MWSIIRPTLLVLLFGGIALLLGWSVTQALRTGTVNAGGKELSRKQRPGAFWSALLFQLAMAIMLALAVVVTLASTLNRPHW
jgi:hypothetical protein